MHGTTPKFAETRAWRRCWRPSRPYTHYSRISTSSTPAAAPASWRDCIAPHVARVSAFDRAADCLAVAREAAPPNVTYAEADLRRLPVADGCADVACAGWARSQQLNSYLKAEHEEWYADGSYGGAWRDEVDAALGELDRALGDGGVAVIFETQGTATAAPRRGGSHLYAHLRDRGFAESCVRTDYSFSTPAAALETLTFFFGKGVASRAAELLRGAPPDEPCTVPECTGVWVRRKRPRVRVGAAARRGSRIRGLRSGRRNQPSARASTDPRMAVATARRSIARHGAGRAVARRRVLARVGRLASITSGLRSSEGSGRHRRSARRGGRGRGTRRTISSVGGAMSRADPDRCARSSDRRAVRAPSNLPITR